MFAVADFADGPHVNHFAVWAFEVIPLDTTLAHVIKRDERLLAHVTFPFVIHFHIHLPDSSGWYPRRGLLPRLVLN